MNRTQERPAATALTEAVVGRYARRICDNEDDCDVIWRDRKTGAVVIHYDGGDPAEWDPKRGGMSDTDRMKSLGLDPNAEIRVSESMLPVTQYDVDNWAFTKNARLRREALRSQREVEEAAALDLWDVLNPKDLGGFSFDNYSRGEIDIFTPLLAALGYMDARFYNVESDSFGPLIRGCEAMDVIRNRKVRFFYG